MKALLNNPVLKHAVVTAAILVVFAAVGTLLLTGTYQHTRAPIAASERAAKLALLAQVLPSSLHDNDLLQHSIMLPADPLLGQRQASTAYLASLAGQPSAVILEVVAPDGYSGDIKLLVGITVSGQLSGVRVLTHKETPGLGDYIEVLRSDWIRQFDGRSLAEPPPAAWAVRKDGGAFDYMAGATITPRAVIRATQRALQYAAAQHALLFPQTSALAALMPASMATPLPTPLSETATGEP